ncbi:MULTISPECIES: DEAD/DEAH box helicase [unclassified Aureispira]|uniref:DEAD/DEAH box helicase n=1 Tax=unclassified Aureispira TaxID=2649989 RepID=UPI0006965B4F|nr:MULTISPECIES: DEAD/DEAH box helicase [unclassified Aureispira]WMX13002.1 DEAD/DEAH box helicase [Aureispira sp. CCB-E]
MTFEELELDYDLLDALDYMGFVEATPIQEQAIPLILEGQDLIACAQTGTGKTAAFILPILNKLAENPTAHTNTLVICPTRELAIQIEKQVQGFAYFVGVSSIAVYGGSGGDDFAQQKRALTQGSNIIVATPGKLISHLNLGYVKFDNIQHLILDEADRMLDMGFLDDIQKIISYLPKKRQNLMFSATMAPKIRTLANQILTQPKTINIALDKPAEGVLQAVYLAYDNQKTPLIHSLISDKPNYERILIFTSTKRKVFDIVRSLRKEGYSVAGISSDLDQDEREKVLLEFKQKSIRILVATDILSRGVDIKDINLVINYDVPGDAADYVHRVGRTARASTTGVALTLVNPDDMYKFARIEKLIESKIPQIPLPKELGEAPEYKVRGGGRNRKGGNKKHYKKKGHQTTKKSNNNRKKSSSKSTKTNTQKTKNKS